MLMMFVKIS